MTYQNMASNNQPLHTGLVVTPINSDKYMPSNIHYEWEKKKAANDPFHIWKWTDCPTNSTKPGHYFAFLFASKAHPLQKVIIHAVTGVGSINPHQEQRPHWSNPDKKNILYLSPPLFEIPYEQWKIMGAAKKTMGTMQTNLNNKPELKKHIETDFILLYKIKRHQNYEIDIDGFHDDFTKTFEREQTIKEWYNELF